MKKILLFAFVLTSIGLQAQTVTITANGSTSSLNIFGTQQAHASEHFYTAAELGSAFTSPSTPINTIAFSVATLGTNTLFSNVKIYLKETTTTITTAGKFSLSGYTLVYSGNVTLNKTGFTSIMLNTPFLRTSASNGLALIMTRESDVTHASYIFASANGNNTNNAAVTSRRYNGTTNAVEGTTDLSTSVYRAAVRFKYTVTNDAMVEEVSAFGKTPAYSVLAADTIKAIITNNGASTLTNLPVTLSVTGANTLTDVKTIPTLLPDASTVVTFNTLVPVNYGVNTITVSVPADDANGNNSKVKTQEVVNDAIRIADDGPAVTQIGYNTGSGLLLVRYRLSENAFVTNVRVSLGSGAVGNSVYGVLLNSSGAILAQSSPYTVQASDVDTYVNFIFPTPVSVLLGTDFYIGIAQTANTTGYFPMNAQSEQITRYNRYFGAALTGGAFTEYPTLGRFMIEAQFNSLLPVKYANFNGEKTENGNRLFWTTTVEQNNSGFEIERSSNGTDFAKIAFTPSIAEGGNSNANLHYTYTDATPSKGNNYYRLKQINKDGKSEYSNVIVIKGAAEGLEIVNIFPNPAVKNLTVKVAAVASEDVQLHIMDVQGKSIIQSTHKLVNGENLINVNVGNLPSGTYFIKVAGKSGVFSTPLTKQ